MASPCIITFGGKKYTYDKWIELLHDGQLDRLIADGSVSINPFSGPKVKAEGKPGEAKGEQAPTETGRLSAPDQVLQRNPDGTFSIQSKADIQNFFERVIGLPTPLAALNATLFELRANAWSQATGMPTDAYYQMYLLRDYVKAEKQEGLGQAIGEYGASQLINAKESLIVAKSLSGKVPDWKIKRDTGWEKGVDGKWRFEISPVSLRTDFTIDENRVWNHVNEADGNQVVFNLNEVADMSILEQLYPSLKNAEFVFTKMKSGDRGAIIKTKDGKTIVYVNANEFIKNGTLNRDELRKTIVHEVQHGIQDIERFASGTNVAAAKRQVNNQIQEINDKIKNKDIGVISKLKLLYQRFVLSCQSGFERYLKTAGEVEARNIVRRISLNDLERSSITLKETEDIKRINQIILTEDQVDWINEKQELGQDGNIPPDTYFEQKEKALKEALENAKSRLEAKKRALAKRIAKEGQMSMFAEQNPLMADFDASNDVIEQILRPFNGEIMRINAEIRDNELARRSAAIGREQQLKLFQPLKQNEGYRGSWSMTPDRKARIIAATLKANATTFIHEYLGHDYLNDIAQAANGGSLIHKNMLTAAVLEFVKYKKGLYKFDQVMAAISQFDPLNKSALPADLLPIAIEFHEFFAEAAQEFMRDADGYEASRPGNEGQAWVALLRSFRDYLVDLASSLYMNGYRLSEPMRQVFRNAFGEMSDIVFDEADAAQDRAMEAVVQMYENMPEVGDVWSGGIGDLKQKVETKAVEGTELFQNVSKETEEKVAELAMRRAVELYKKKIADKFNIIDILKKEIDKSTKTDESKAIMKAIVDSRAEQIKSLYEPSQGKKFRQTAQTLLEEGTETRPAEYAFEEDVKRILRGEMGEYTPVSLNKMVQDAAAYIEDKKNDLDVVYKVLESFSDVNKFPNWVPIASLYLRELQARNRTLRTQNTPQANQQIQENLVKISKIFDRLLNEATERGRRLNELKAMSLLDPRTLVWIQKKNFKESFKEQNQKLQEDVRALLKSLQEYKEQATEYIQNLVKKTETIESLQNEITSLSERIASLEELRKKNFVGNAFGKELDFLRDEKDVEKVFNDYLDQITESDDLELFSSAGLTPLQGLFYAVMTPTKKGGANQFKDLGFIYQLLSERLAKKGKAIQLSTAADYYRQMRDLLISEGASPTHFLDNDQVDQRVEELKESSEANIESLRQKLEAKKAALAAKKIKKEKKKDLQAEIEATIKRYANIKNVRNAMIALGEDMKNLAFEEDADIDAVEQQVLDMISNRARSSNVDDAIVDQIRQKVKTLFDNYRKAVWDGVSQSIAKTINERARKALNVTQPAVDTTFSEFVRLLGEKANELYRKQFAEEAANRGVKPKTKTPEESLAFAVRALNDENGMKLWEEAKEATRNRILADDKISPIDKQVALTMLDKFLHNIYDSVLPETDRLKLVRKAMDEAGLLSSTNTVAWTAIWEKSRGDKAKARELVKDKIRQYLPAQSSDNVTDKLIDILMDKYDAYIEERRIKLVDSQLKAMQKGIDKLTQGTKTSRVKRRSFAQKFIRLVNSGFFSDPQSVTPEKARELFAQYLGLTRTPSAQEWAQVEGLAQEIQDAPEGHERDLATEKLSAWFEYYKPGYGAKVKQSVFISNLLGGLSTLIKNTQGWMEVVTKAVTAFGKDIIKYRKDLPFSNPLAMPDFNYFKVMLKGFRQGDFLDVLRNGGVNQGDNLSVTTDPAGFSRVRILEYYQPKNKYQVALKSLRYIGRIMSAFDAASQRSVSEIAYYQLLKQLTEKSDPSLSPREVAKRAYNAMYSINIEEATTLAKQTFDEMGIIRPDKARLRRMAYQNIRNARKDPSKIEEYEALQEVTNSAALEEAFKSKMLDNVGIATIGGFAIEKAMQGIYEIIRTLATFTYPGNKFKQQKAQARLESLATAARLQVLPFMTGVFNFMEKTLEKLSVYAALKGASQLSYVGYRGRKMKASPDEYSEFDKINQMYLANRAYEHLIRAGILFAIEAVISALIMGSADDDDEDSIKIIGSETFGKKGFGAKKNIYPENSIVFPNGIALPLAYLSTYGTSLGLQANMRDALKAIKKKWRQEKPTISDYISVLPDVFMRSLGTFLEMGMLEGTNRALRAVTNYDADTWLTGAIINWSVNSNLPWIGLSRQAADTYRELAGQATTPMTFTEKAMRSLGVPSLIVEGKPALDWRGRPLRPMIKNSSGIAGIVGAAKPLQMDEVDKFLDKNDVLLQWKRSSDPDVTTEDDIVRYSFPQEIRYYYRASVSTGWDVAIQRMYYKRNARVLTEREEKNGYTKDDVVAKDMAKMHNAIERYSGNFIKVLSLTQTAREAKDNMEDAKKDIKNILMRYQSEADINSGEAEVKAQGQAKNIVNIVKSVILDKPGDYESATAPWYAKPFLNSND